MRYAIISDIHGNERYLNQALKIIKDEEVNNKICLGDVIGKSGDYVECLEELIANDFMIVVGNHDRLGIESLPKKDDYSFKNLFKPTIKLNDLTFSHTTNSKDALYGRMPWEDNRRIDNISKAQNQFQNDNSQIFFYGHSHIAEIFELKSNGSILRYEASEETLDINKNSRYLINPGPITNIRDIKIENPYSKEKEINPSFLIYDDKIEQIKYHFLE